MKALAIVGILGILAVLMISGCGDDGTAPSGDGQAGDSGSLAIDNSIQIEDEYGFELVSEEDVDIGELV